MGPDGSPEVLQRDSKGPDILQRGSSRLATFLRDRFRSRGREKKWRGRREPRSASEICNSESDSLGSSLRCKCGGSRGIGYLTRSNSTQSAQSAATLHTLLSSSTSARGASEDGVRQSSMQNQDGGGEYACYEDLGSDNVLDGVEVIAERDMNSFQKHIPGLQRHDAKTSTIRQHYYPEGGWGWLVCACVFIVHVLTSGLQYSFGVLLTDLLNHLPQHRPIDACWVGSCSLAVSRASAPLVVALCRRKSTRLTAVIGGLVMALAILFASFALHLHQIFLSYGLVLGVGIGMTRETANLMLGQYFKRRREFVEIISQSGCGIGITLFSVFFKEAIRSVGWRLGLQAVTGVVFSAFFLGIFYRSASLYHPQRRAILHLKNQKRKQVKDKHKVDFEKPPYFDVTCLKLHSVRVLLITATFTSAGLYTPLFFLVLDAKREGLEESSLILLQTFLGFAYALGCIGFGLIVVRQSEQCLISRQYLCQAALYGLGITMLALTAIQDYHGYVLFNWLYGVMLGGAHYSFQMLTLEKVRARHFSRAWSFIQGATALPVLIGIPVIGYINESNPKTGYFLASVFLLCGASCLFLLNFYKDKMVKQHDTSVSFTTVDSHLSQEPPYAIPKENGSGRNVSGTSRDRGSVDSGSIVSRDSCSGSKAGPICTCGVDSKPSVPLSCTPIDPQAKNQLNKLGKTISFASSVDVMEPRLKPELLTCISEEGIYYDYMMDCMTSYHPDNNYYHECGAENLSCSVEDKIADDRPKLDPKSRSPARLPLHLTGRKLRQASGVSFSEPEGLARLGQTCNMGAMGLRLHPCHGKCTPPVPLPCPSVIQGPPPPVRPRRNITIIEEMTTSV